MAGAVKLESVDDLGDLLTEVRGWTGVIEKKPLVFYVGREPFLHFHRVEGARRRADVKGRDGWKQIDLPEPLGKTTRRALLRELRARYLEKSAADQQRPAARPRAALSRGAS